MPGQTSQHVTPNTQSDYYSRRNVLRRLIKDSDVKELVELIKLEKLDHEVETIKREL